MILSALGCDLPAPPEGILGALSLKVQALKGSGFRVPALKPGGVLPIENNRTLRVHVPNNKVLGISVIVIII